MYLCAEASEDKTERHHERSGECYQFEVLDPDNYGIDENASAPGQSIPNSSNQRNDSVSALRIHYISFWRGIELLKDMQLLAFRTSPSQIERIDSH